MHGLVKKRWVDTSSGMIYSTINIRNKATAQHELCKKPNKKLGVKYFALVCIKPIQPVYQNRTGFNR
jgi:hypothetical protein